MKNTKWMLMVMSMLLIPIIGCGIYAEKDGFKKAWLFADRNRAGIETHKAVELLKPVTNKTTVTCQLDIVISPEGKLLKSKIVYDHKIPKAYIVGHKIGGGQIAPDLMSLYGFFQNAIHQENNQYLSFAEEMKMDAPDAILYRQKAFLYWNEQRYPSRIDKEITVPISVRVNIVPEGIHGLSTRKETRAYNDFVDRQARLGFPISAEKQLEELEKRSARARVTRYSSSDGFRDIWVYGMTLPNGRHVADVYGILKEIQKIISWETNGRIIYTSDERRKWVLEVPM